MAKRKVISLGGKKFFSMVVLSSLALGLIVTTFALQQPTNTESEASGASGVSLNECITKNAQYIGGVKLYNGDGQTGGNRVLCIKNPNYNNKNTTVDNLNKIDVKDPNKYNDIWGNFQKKAESMKIITLGGCKIRVNLYSEYNAPKSALLGKYEYSRIYKNTNTKSFEIPNNQDNKTKSIKVYAECPVRT